MAITVRGGGGQRCIAADIETGGINIAGVAGFKQATDSFHITGREKAGVVTAGCDGEDLRIIVSRHEKL
jgi:hypothetical protein